jgi:serine/threonine protein kinase
MPVPPTTPAELLNLILKAGITTPDELAESVPDRHALPATAPKAATALMQRGVITKFQARQLLLGRHKGFTLGSYVILDQLGRGGMGAVYLAEHRDLHRKVAIKVLIPSRDEDAKLANERFFREARAAAALDHPNIVRIHDVARHNDTPFLVMEYVEGETLQQIIDRKGAIPHSAAADMIAQAAAGLQHAHERGFVHRDIKPGNLIREAGGAVKILDMGLARSSDDEAQRLTEKLDAGAVVGTADFIAPEQALNGTTVDVRADVYSLGASFFALVTGKPPFGGNTTQKLLHHQMRPAPRLSTLDPSVPEGLSAVVAKMMAKKPADRYQTPAEVIAALAPWVGGSARVLAGLSQTKIVIGSGSGSHPSLNDIATGLSSGRLTIGGPVPAEDSAEISPFLGAPETGAVASAETARAPAHRKKPGHTPAATPTSRKALLLYAAGGLALLLVGAVIGWLVSH